MRHFSLLFLAVTTAVAAMAAPLTVSQSLDRIEEACAEAERSARREWLLEERRGPHTADILYEREEERRRRVNKARKQYQKRLEEIAENCRDAKQDYWKQFAQPRAKPKNTAKSSSHQKSPGASVLSDASWETRLTYYSAYRTGRPTGWRRNRLELNLVQSARLFNSVRFYASEQGWFDPTVRHNNGELPSGAPEDNLEDELQLRDAFLDFNAGPLDVRLGRQSIVWGDLTTLFVADVVNGKDLREWILPDFDWIRIPQWSLDLSAIQGPVSAEVIWTVPEFHRFAKPGSDFAFPVAVPPGLVRVAGTADEPAVNTKNSVVGGRVGALIGGFDLGAFALDGWDQAPVPFRRVVGGNYVEEPEYRRQTYVGGTFSWSLGRFILKGEGVHRPSSWIGTTDPLDEDGVVRRDTWDYAVGVDRNLWGIDANLQWIERRVSGKDADELFNERSQRRQFAAWVRWENAVGKWSPEFLVITDVDRSDRLWRPRISGKIGNRTELRVGWDIFQGEPNQGLFGIFEDQDRAYVQTDIRF